MSDTLTRDRETLLMELQSVADQAEAIGGSPWASRYERDLGKLIASLATIVAALEGGE